MKYTSWMRLVKKFHEIYLMSCPIITIICLFTFLDPIYAQFRKYLISYMLAIYIATILSQKCWNICPFILSQQLIRSNNEDDYQVYYNKNFFIKLLDKFGFKTNPVSVIIIPIIFFVISYILLILYIPL